MEFIMLKGQLFGSRTEVKGSCENKRSLQRENESADILVAQGYHVEQNPVIKTSDNLKEGVCPDYRINDEFFDHYAPNNKADVEQIQNQISKKIKRQQTYRIVLNLDDSQVSIENIQTMFLTRKPILKLQQLIIVKNKQIIRLI